MNTSFCRIANKVAMHLRYVTTTSDRQVAKSMVDEAFLLTLQLFDQTDSTELHQRYSQDYEQVVIATNHGKTSHAVWSQWNADACEALRSFGFQEKLIAAIGDEMNRWEYSHVKPKLLFERIADVAAACSTSAIAVSNAMLVENDQTPAPESKIDGFWKAVCGLAILLTSIKEPHSALKSNEFPTRAALSCFGGYLITCHASRLKTGP